jgi:hypothetical protein
VLVQTRCGFAPLAVTETNDYPSESRDGKFIASFFRREKTPTNKNISKLEMISTNPNMPGFQLRPPSHTLLLNEGYNRGEVC